MLVAFFVILLGVLAVFQLALVAGAPLGRFAWGGRREVLPVKLRVASAVSVVIYGAMVLVALARAGVTGDMEHYPLVVAAMWVIACYMVVGVAVNALSRSKRERYVMTPMALALAVLAIALALQP